MIWEKHSVQTQRPRARPYGSGARRLLVRRGPKSLDGFSVELTRATEPWAFARGQPFRTIAALELYATLVCVAVFGKHWSTSTFGRLRLSGVTDKLGNALAMNKLMSSKFPLVVILTELAAQLQERNLDLRLDWVPRLQNEEADALTNQVYGDFSAGRRIQVNVAELRWILMDKMLLAAEDIHAAVTERKELAGGEKKARQSQRKQRRENKLRRRDPW